MPAGILGHMWHALRHALTTILAWAGVAFIATILVSEVVAYFTAGSSALLEPTTHLAAFFLALAIGYGVGFLTLMVETIGLVMKGAQDLERAGISGVKRLERIEQSS